MHIVIIPEMSTKEVNINYLIRLKFASCNRMWTCVFNTKEEKGHVDVRFHVYYDVQKCQLQ
jgi:hypothetical protein